MCSYDFVHSYLITNVKCAVVLLDYLLWHNVKSFFKNILNLLKKEEDIWLKSRFLQFRIVFVIVGELESEVFQTILNQLKGSSLKEESEHIKLENNQTSHWGKP